MRIRDIATATAGLVFVSGGASGVAVAMYNGLILAADSLQKIPGGHMTFDQAVWVLATASVGAAVGLVMSGPDAESVQVDQRTR